MSLLHSESESWVSDRLSCLQVSDFLRRAVSSTENLPGRMGSSS